MSFRLFGFTKDRIQHVHCGGKDGGGNKGPNKNRTTKSRPWRRLISGLALIAALGFGGYAAQTEEGKQGLSYAAAVYAPDQLLNEISDRYGAEMAVYLAKAQSGTTAPEDIMRYNSAYKRLLQTADPQDRDNIVQAYLALSSDLGIALMDQETVAGSTAVLMEQFFAANTDGDRAKARSLMLRFETQQFAPLTARLYAETVAFKLKTTETMSADDMVLLTGLMPAMSAHDNGQPGIQAIVDNLGKTLEAADEGGKRLIAESFAAHADLETIKSLDEANVMGVMDPLLSYYLTAEDREIANRMNMSMERFENAANDEFIKSAYRTVVPRTMDAMSPEAVQSADHKPMGLALNWLVHIYYEAEDVDSQMQARALIEKHYRNVGLDPDFLEHFKPKRDTWHNWVRDNKEEIDGAKAKWAEWTDDERLAYLQSVVEKHSEIFGFTEAPLNVYNCFDPERPEACTGPAYAVAFYWPSQDEIYFNAGLGYWDDFELMFSAAVHENTHNHQDEMAKRFLKGEYKDNPAIADQAAIFAWSNYYYVNYNFRLYQEQSWERHAWWTQKNLKKVRTELSKQWSDMLDEAPPAVTGKWAEKYPQYDNPKPEHKESKPEMDVPPSSQFMAPRPGPGTIYEMQSGAGMNTLSQPYYTQPADQGKRDNSKLITVKGREIDAVSAKDVIALQHLFNKKAKKTHRKSA